ncbi:hypothetical protein AB4Y38_24520 [Paraburkholderia sp. EG285A]|uniref:hypothetical protein n=1 Tax=Paraburkholderia sp. EG285A TaxID=3237009 RepID=UPI0034D1B476
MTINNWPTPADRDEDVRHDGLTTLSPGTTAGSENATFDCAPQAKCVGPEDNGCNVFTDLSGCARARSWEILRKIDLEVVHFLRVNL